ncbi:MAG: phosphohydrolase [Sphaerochaetaceae bacterium]
MKSPKEHSLERRFLSLFPEDTASHRLAEALVDDQEIQAMQDYGNSVSIKRLGFNDHGPVHMRQVAYNAVVMLDLLRDAGVRTSLELEGTGTYEDSLCAVVLAAFLHDLGMTIGRQDHELLSCLLAQPIIDRILAAVLPDSLQRRVVIRSLALEGIFGHMATRRIHSLEAGLILIADGCDMEKGRARIPMALNTTPKTGDIHKYSANSIENVTIGKGNRKPIKIEVEMSTDVGLFQIEEVLLPKIDMSPDKPFVELYAHVTGQDPRQYL